MAWQKILALGLIGSAVFVGCTVTTDDDGGDDDGGTGGKTSTGGSTATGGKATGGGGSTATGGAATGGTDSGTFTCKAETDSCANCIEAKCCTEWLECGGDPACGEKNTANEGEFLCIQGCLIDQISSDAGEEIDLPGCAAQCAVDSSGIPSDATQAFVACVRGTGDAGLQNCSTVCFGAEIPE